MGEWDVGSGRTAQSIQKRSEILLRLGELVELILCPVNSSSDFFDQLEDIISTLASRLRDEYEYDSLLSKPQRAAVPQV